LTFSSKSVASILDRGRKAKSINRCRLEKGTVELLSTDSLIGVDTSAGNVVIQLPKAETLMGQRLRIYKTSNDANVVRVVAFPGETISMERDLKWQYEDVDISCDDVDLWG
jgi:hypothetical protein